MDFPLLLVRTKSFLFRQKPLVAVKQIDSINTTEYSRVNNQIVIYDEMLFVLNALDTLHAEESKSRFGFGSNKKEDANKHRIYIRKFSLQGRIRREKAKLEKQLTHLSK